MSPTADEELNTARVSVPIMHPLIYRKRLAGVDTESKPGDLLAVYHEGEVLGYGLYNPRSEIALRMVRHGVDRPDDAYWRGLLERAVSLRTDFLRIPEHTDAYRIVHAEADGFPGLMIDRYGDTLSAEVFSVGMAQRVGEILDLLAPICGTEHVIVQPAPRLAEQEGCLLEPWNSPNLPAQVEIQEFGTRFRVNFRGGHKTGFFCDQRDNRRRLAEFCEGKTVLDLCSYTGGFAVQAKVLGKAGDVTAVDLDKEPLELAKQNANLNSVRVKCVQADVFTYMRDMLRAGRQFDVVVLDPPKLIHSRGEIEEGTRRHFDLNRLAMQVVAPGGLLLSCTCSGLLQEAEFMKLLFAASRQAGEQYLNEEGKQRGKPRGMQVVAKSGAATDHPISANCPETEYLNAAWMRLD